MDKNELYKNIDDHISKIGQEFKRGLNELSKYPKSVTIFGSSRIPPGNKYYAQAEELASRIVKETAYAVITGGGPGIMAAANLGAIEAKGNSIGLTIQLPHEQHTNPYTTSTVNFDYFFVRKSMMTFSSEAYVFFPGGYGTFDEFFSVITLLQTGKIPRVPMILIGKKFWNELKNFMQKNMLEENQAIEKNDFDLFIITDDLDKVIDIIKKAPVSRWWEQMD